MFYSRVWRLPLCQVRASGLRIRRAVGLHGRCTSGQQRWKSSFPSPCFRAAWSRGGLDETGGSELPMLPGHFGAMNAPGPRTGCWCTGGAGIDKILYQLYFSSRRPAVSRQVAARIRGRCRQLPEPLERAGHRLDPPASTGWTAHITQYPYRYGTCT